MTAASQFVVCYALDTGAGYDVQLAGLGRQICEDLAEILALNERFTTVPQMVVVREDGDLQYRVDKNACAFAVFYSLPETQWILNATRAIGGDIALTGRIMDDETGLLLSINLIDAAKGQLLFCGYETCARHEIQDAIAQIGAKMLSHFTDKTAAEWLDDVFEMLGTRDFHAYMNWLNMREIERRAQREGMVAPRNRLVEHLTHALDADPDYAKAGLKLCEMMGGQLDKSRYEFILRYLASRVLQNEAIALIVVQCLARLGKRTEAVSALGQIIAKYPENGLFYLMRGCLSNVSRQISADLDKAKKLLGNDFHGCRSAVDGALLNVTGV